MAKNQNDQALSGTIRVGKIHQLQKRINENAALVDAVTDRLVHDYCLQLDEYMAYIKNILEDTQNPPTDAELDDFTLNLPVLLYFAGEAQESLGIKEDVAKAVKQEVYNQAYEMATGTIADKTAAAELATQTEFVAHVAYNRAYKKVKLRMEAANETLQSIKKVISRRMAEYQLSGVDSGRIGGTNGQTRHFNQRV